MRTNVYIAAATISASLDGAAKKAALMSLTACNAKALTMRVGNSAAGFRALTNSIDELVTKIRTTSLDINAKAMSVCKLATTLQRLVLFRHRVSKSQEVGSEQGFADSLTVVISNNDSEVEDLRQQLAVLIRDISDKIDVLENELKASAVISTLCMVEASQSPPDFRSSLDSVAEDLASHANEIRKEISSCKSCMVSIAA